LCRTRPEASALPRGDLRGDHQRQSITISNTGKRPESSPQADDDRVLHAKYLDWCSAQVADHFLALSPDEIFELAERSGRDEGRTTGAQLVEADLASYRSVVERVTEVLTRQLELPTFESWLELYRTDRESVEAQLLGLWRERS
jgi:hypothetical protein